MGERDPLYKLSHRIISLSGVEDNWNFELISQLNLTLAEGNLVLYSPIVPVEVESNLAEGIDFLFVTEGPKGLKLPLERLLGSPRTNAAATLLG